MSTRTENENKPHLLCRLFGHKWKPAHRLDANPYGIAIWVYTDDICQRCWKTEYRLPRGEHLAARVNR